MTKYLPIGLIGENKIRKFDINNISRHILKVRLKSVEEIKIHDGLKNQANKKGIPLILDYIYAILKKPKIDSVIIISSL